MSLDTTATQPYRVDWRGKPESFEDLNTKLARLCTNIDEMFDILFHRTIQASATPASGMTPAQVAARITLHI